MNQRRATVPRRWWGRALRDGTPVLALLAALSAAAPPAAAQLVNGRFATSFYAWEAYDDTLGSSRTYLRAFQVAQLSVAQGDVSLHTYLQGAVNASSEFGDHGRVRAYNLYLRWANIGRAVDLSLGRQAVYAGVGNGTIDGVMLRARLFQDRLTVAGYGGATTPYDYLGVRTNWHDNLSFGGQIVTTAIRGARIGLSYMNRREERVPYTALRSRDTTFVPVPYLIQTESPAEEYLSGDASYSLDGRLSVYGRYDHDLHLARTARGQAGARVSVTRALSLTADYIYRRPRIAFNSIFSAFVTNSVSEIEGGAEYGFTPLLRAFGRLASVTYSDESSLRWTLGLNGGYGSVSYAGSNGYAGELQSFAVSGSYPLMNNALTPTAGLNYASYRLSKEADRQSALGVVVGAVVRPMQKLWFDLQGQLLTNPLYKSDLRLQAKVTYWFSERLSIFKEEL